MVRGSLRAGRRRANRRRASSAKRSVRRIMPALSSAALRNRRSAPLSGAAVQGSPRSAPTRLPRVARMQPRLGRLARGVGALRRPSITLAGTRCLACGPRIRKTRLRLRSRGPTKVPSALPAGAAPAGSGARMQVLAPRTGDGSEMPSLRSGACSELSFGS